MPRRCNSARAAALINMDFSYFRRSTRRWCSSVLLVSSFRRFRFRCSSRADSFADNSGIVARRNSLSSSKSNPAITASASAKAASSALTAPLKRSTTSASKLRLARSARSRIRARILSGTVTVKVWEVIVWPPGAPSILSPTVRIATLCVEVQHPECRRQRSFQILHAPKPRVIGRAVGWVLVARCWQVAAAIAIVAQE